MADQHSGVCRLVLFRQHTHACLDKICRCDGADQCEQVVQYVFYMLVLEALWDIHAGSSCSCQHSPICILTYTIYYTHTIELVHPARIQLPAFRLGTFGFPSAVP